MMKGGGEQPVNTSLASHPGDCIGLVVQYPVNELDRVELQKELDELSSKLRTRILEAPQRCGHPQCSALSYRFCGLHFRDGQDGHQQEGKVWSLYWNIRLLLSAIGCHVEHINNPFLRHMLLQIELALRPPADHSGTEQSAEWRALTVEKL